MLKEHISFFRKLEMLADLILAAVVFYVGYPYGGGSPVLPAFLVLWLAMLYILGLYESFRIKNFSDIILTVWAAAFIGIGMSGATAYLLNIESLNRLFVVFIFFGAAILTSVEKIAAMIFLRHVRKKGYNSRNILVVGTGPRAQQFINLISLRADWGLRIVGLIDEDTSLTGKEIKGLKVIGTLRDVADIVHDNVVDEIVFIVPRSWLHKVEEVVFFCETEGIRAHIAIDVFDLKFAKATQTELENYLLLTFERTPIKVWQLFIKGFLDIVVSAILLTAMVPLFVLVAVAIKLTSPGPVFYRQTRCGLKGRKFTLYKFRTMVEDAEKLLPELLQNNEMQGPVFKMNNDPRITPLGKVLRKFSLDELPQLWNVFKRDMSIVGPRPPLPEEVKRYDNWQRRRLSMRPGITCLWQVRGRNKITDFNEWSRLDLHYIDHWSFFGDFKIFMETIPAVVFGIGAK